MRNIILLCLFVFSVSAYNTQSDIEKEENNTTEVVIFFTQEEVNFLDGLSCSGILVPFQKSLAVKNKRTSLYSYKQIRHNCGVCKDWAKIGGGNIGRKGKSIKIEYSFTKTTYTLD